MSISEEGRRYLVHGRVHGVGFRYFVERRAGQLGLRGYVMNRADGTVEVLAAGPAGKLRQLAVLLAEGPRLARVERVEESPVEPEATTGFRVRY